MTERPSGIMPIAREPSDQTILSELARVKALFQARTIAAVIGAPAPVSLDPVRPDASLYDPETQAEMQAIHEGTK